MHINITVKLYWILETNILKAIDTQQQNPIPDVFHCPNTTWFRRVQKQRLFKTWGNPVWYKMSLISPAEMSRRQTDSKVQQRDTDATAGISHRWPRMMWIFPEIKTSVNYNLSNKVKGTESFTRCMRVGGCLQLLSMNGFWERWSQSDGSVSELSPEILFFSFFLVCRDSPAFFESLSDSWRQKHDRPSVFHCNPYSSPGCDSQHFSVCYKYSVKWINLFRESLNCSLKWSRSVSATWAGVRAGSSVVFGWGTRSKSWVCSLINKTWPRIEDWCVKM